MKCVFIEYPKCSTCKKAKKYLDEKSISYEDRNIVEDTPSYEEMKSIIKKSKEDIKKFFNTSGMLYKSMKLKDKLDDMSFDEKLKLLVSDGMLIKRPLIILDDNVIIGFKEDKLKEIFDKG